MSQPATTYRDDRDAALAQVQALQRENRALHQRLNNLQDTAALQPSARPASKALGATILACLGLLVLCNFVWFYRSYRAAHQPPIPPPCGIKSLEP